MRRSVAVPLAALVLAAPAAAQTMMDLGTLSLGIQQTQQDMFLNQSINQRLATAPEANARPGRSAPEPRRGPAPAEATRFHPAPGDLTPVRFAAQAAPDRRAALQRYFTDLLADYRKAALAKQAPANDVSRAAVYYIASLAYVNAGGRDLTLQQADALRAQMHDAFGANPRFRALNDRERQEMFEGYVIQGGHITNAFDNARDKGDRARMAQLQAISRDSLQRMMGAPPEQIRFTASGIRIGG